MRWWRKLNNKITYSCWLTFYRPVLFGFPCNNAYSRWISRILYVLFFFWRKPLGGTLHSKNKTHSKIHGCRTHQIWYSMHSTTTKKQFKSRLFWWSCFVIAMKATDSLKDRKKAGNYLKPYTYIKTFMSSSDSEQVLSRKPLCRRFCSFDLAQKWIFTLICSSFYDFFFSFWKQVNMNYTNYGCRQRFREK